MGEVARQGRRGTGRSASTGSPSALRAPPPYDGGGVRKNSYAIALPAGRGIREVRLVHRYFHSHSILALPARRIALHAAWIGGGLAPWIVACRGGEAGLRRTRLD